MLNIILFGAPGAGKGTQSEKLIEKYSLVHLSTGDILRNEIVACTKLGLEAKAFMDKGELVPDNVVIGMIEHKIDENKNAKGFIFDGFPRTVAQAEALDNMLTNKKQTISQMIAIDVESDELVKRLQVRADIQNRPDDKDINVINNRIKVYNEKTAILADYYDKQGKFVKINGMGTVYDIFTRLCNEVDKNNL
jgi:adenylate kinase